MQDLRHNFAAELAHHVGANVLAYEYVGYSLSKLQGGVATEAPRLLICDDRR